MSKIYDLSFKPYTGQRTSTFYRTWLMYIGYIKYILVTSYSGFKKFLLYGALSIPILSAISQLFFEFIKSNLAKSVVITYGNVTNSASFPLYISTAIVSSFLISTIVSSDYPVFIRYRHMEKGLWASLYGVTFSLLFIPMFLAYMVMFIGASIIFFDKIIITTIINELLLEILKWLLASIILTNIIITISLIVPNPTFSSILTIVYPTLVSLILAIIRELTSIPSEILNMLEISEVMGPNSLQYLLINLLIYLAIMTVVLIYRRHHTWR